MHQSPIICLGLCKIACSFTYSFSDPLPINRLCLPDDNWIWAGCLTFYAYLIARFMCQLRPHCVLQLGIPKRLSIFVGNESPTIVRYLDPWQAISLLSLWWDNLPVIRGRYEQICSTGTTGIVVVCPHFVSSWSPTQYSERSRFDAWTFSDIDKVTRSNTPAANMPARLKIS